jgi:excinuclease ABC subunit B
MTFKLDAPFNPHGDQPKAIKKLIEGLSAGQNYQTLLGVTGSGKTFTMAKVIEAHRKPTLILAPNKTLAAQLCNEFKQFFPQNAVEYFVSYYDYYQPEAYLPQTDTFIEKDSAINDEIDRLRHSATSALLSRGDVIIVASVSCIYGLGSPEDYLEKTVPLEVNKDYNLREITKKMVSLQYARNDISLTRGNFRVRGDVLEILPAYEESIYRFEFFGDTLEKITKVNPVTGLITENPKMVIIYPASHFVTQSYKLEKALVTIEEELKERLAQLRSQNKLLEAQRLEMRTKYDLEMLREIGFCKGIENYSRHFSGKAPGEPPDTLLEYFPDEFLTIIDESHISIPQIHGMHGGDHSRKTTLVEHGFRLPSAIDNRPLKFEEFEARIGQAVFVSATPGPFELKVSRQIVEQLIRPTGLIDPEVIVRKTEGQIEDLLGEIKKRTKSGERVLVTTLTKKMAENLSDYLFELGVKVRYMHSDTETTNRIELLTDLRKGVYDVLVGINLLREGLDLPEVTLVAILDADKEGFLRSERSLIQTIGRAARNVSGQVIMYADKMTDSMNRAIGETNRRRAVQQAYNKANNIEPKTIQRAVGSILQDLRAAEEQEQYGKKKKRLKEIELMDAESLWGLIQNLEEEMHLAAAELSFEYAAKLRDEADALKKFLNSKVRKERKKEAKSKI